MDLLTDVSYDGDVKSANTLTTTNESIFDASSWMTCGGNFSTSTVNSYWSPAGRLHRNLPVSLFEFTRYAMACGLVTGLISICPGDGLPSIVTRPSTCR